MTMTAVEERIRSMGAEHLHEEDYPVVIHVLNAMFGHRLHRMSDGLLPTQCGLWVNWQWLLLEGPLSSTETATLLILRGMKTLERTHAKPAAMGSVLSAAMEGRWTEACRLGVQLGRRA